MAAKYKIVFDRGNCIGAAPCVAANPDVWEMAQDAKATLKGGAEASGKWEREIDEKDLEKNLAAARVCPVNVIKIVNAETGEEVA